MMPQVDGMRAARGRGHGENLMHWLGAGSIPDDIVQWRRPYISSARKCECRQQAVELAHTAQVV
jgi:hypothetical protein